MTDTKVCTGCGVTFSRRPCDTNWKWDRRKCCSRSCGGRAVMADPDVRARHKAVMADLFADPDYRARHRVAASANGRLAASMSDRAKGGQTRSRKVIGWIPSNFRQHYKRLRERHGARQAKVIMRQMLADDGKRIVQETAAAMRAKHEREQRDRY